MSALAGGWAVDDTLARGESRQREAAHSPRHPGTLAPRPRATPPASGQPVFHGTPRLIAC